MRSLHDLSSRTQVAQAYPRQGTHRAHKCHRPSTNRTPKRRLTLYKSGEHFAARLQERVADDDLEELFETGAPALDDVVGEAVGEDLAGEGRDGDARALALEDVPEVLEVAVPPAHAALAQLEGGDVGPADDLVVGVHVPRRAVRARVADLCADSVSLSGERYAYGLVTKGTGASEAGEFVRQYAPRCDISSS